MDFVGDPILVLHVLARAIHGFAAHRSRMTAISRGGAPMLDCLLYAPNAKWLFAPHAALCSIYGRPLPQYLHNI